MQLRLQRLYTRTLCANGGTGLVAKGISLSRHSRVSSVKAEPSPDVLADAMRLLIPRNPEGAHPLYDTRDC